MLYVFQKDQAKSNPSLHLLPFILCDISGFAMLRKHVSTPLICMYEQAPEGLGLPKFLISHGVYSCGFAYQLA